ncbi:X-Pro dipeptidase [Lactobacillus delbrueckii subsp. bulgaricus 2038]|nr:X-Pro dipeptidase [Lactobacillus delbrueckii subsp. bulgaricus 2038]
MSKNNELLSLLTRRIKGTADLIKDKDADALLVFNRANYRYLTNFTGEEAQLIITKNGDRVLLSDSRFAPQIEAQAVGELKVVMKHGHEAAEIAAEVKKLGVKKLLVEAEFVSAYEYDAIKSQLPDVDLVMAAEIVERVRNVKDDLELATLKKAVEISERAFEEVLPMLKPGAKERDVGAKLDYLFKLYGGDGPGYDSIIASGPRFSWAPGVASDRLMQEHELVVIDAAASYNGYTADITRTYALGSVEDELEKIYKIVLEAQKRGIAAAVAGATGKDVDQAARGYI